MSKENKREVSVGDRYMHFKAEFNKNPEALTSYFYDVIAIATNANDLTKQVVYQNNADGRVWVRDYDDFMGEVDKEKYPESGLKWRFMLLSKGVTGGSSTRKRPEINTNTLGYEEAIREVYNGTL